MGFSSLGVWLGDGDKDQREGGDHEEVAGDEGDRKGGNRVS